MLRRNRATNGSKSELKKNEELESEQVDCTLAAYRYENEIERNKRGIKRISGKPSEDSSK